MKIINVSADLNSQHNIRQQAPVNIGEQVRGELYEATTVEATSESAQTSTKKGRKTKRVQPEEV